MDNVNINHKDRGLDSSRIENIINLFEAKINGKIPKYYEVERNAREAFKKTYESEEEYKALLKDYEEVRSQISELEKKKSEISEKIRKYATFDENSLKELEERIKTYSKTAENLKQNFIEEIWLAKDIEAAKEIFDKYTAEVEALIEKGY